MHSDFFIDSYVEIADTYMSAAESWVDSLDRSVLGRFASNRERLILIRAQDAYDEEAHFDRSKWSMDVTEIFESRMMELFKGTFESGYDEELIIDVTSELYLWKLITQTGNPSYVNDLRRDMGGVDETMTQLELIIDNPDALSFFESDIWDMDFITDCIASDVDAAIAKEMLTSRAA